MILQNTIDKVNSFSVVEVAKDFGLDLKKAGSNWQCCCPSHNEKTPSFTLSDRKNIWKCFGCGISGVGAISLVCEIKKVDFFTAVKMLCDQYNIAFEQTSTSDADNEKYKHIESLYAAVSSAHRFYTENLKHNIIAQDAIKGRHYTLDDAVEFGIGATGDRTLSAWAKNNGVSCELLAEAGILKKRDDGSIVDRYWNRLMFPIRDKYGRVVSFTGRDISPNKDSDAPKYLNGNESPIFQKNKCLFAYAEAKREIVSKGEAVLSEGPFDVMRLHQRKILNSVGTLGTNISDDQLAMLGKAESVILIGDTDKPGIQSIIKQGKKLAKYGKSISVMPLVDPFDNCDVELSDYYQYRLTKRDPDEFFERVNIRDCLSNVIKFPEFLANIVKRNGGSEEDILNEVAPIMVNMQPSSIELMLSRLKPFIPSKKAWTSKITELKNLGDEKKVKVQLNKNEVDIFNKYGFYEVDNTYVFKTRFGEQCGSNFVLRPLFHIKGINSKRMFEMINTNGIKEVIELPQKDLISLQAFNLAVESEGDFIFLSGEAELKKLKKFLYETTDSCREITQLGWQQEGFYAFSNGVVYKNRFVEIDHLGIVSINSNKFYLPAFSDIYKNENKLYVFERQFAFFPGSVDIKTIASMYEKVFGENGIISFMFYMSSLYRDIIFNTAKSFPLLFLFGAKGTGKSACAISVLQFFGQMAAGPNINSTTKAALADHLGATVNSVQHIEEYRNDIDTEKCEMLKGVWDGTGRSRMNMEKDKKKETTHIDCAVMCSGQQMPTADEALFTRVLFLCFKKDTFTNEEKIEFNRLRDIEHSGLTHITSSLMEYRDAIKNQFAQVYKTTIDYINEHTGNVVVQERLVKNWATIQAVFYIISKFIDLPWSTDYTMSIILKMMLRQSNDVSKGSEVVTFWSSVEYMVAEKQIEENFDFVKEIIYPDTPKAKAMGLILDKPKTTIIIRHTRVFPKYAQFGKATGENTQKRDTISYYLTASAEFIGNVKSQRFKVRDDMGNATGSVVSTGLMFDYDRLKSAYDITLFNDNSDIYAQETGNTDNNGDQFIPF